MRYRRERRLVQILEAVPGASLSRITGPAGFANAAAQNLGSGITEVRSASDLSEAHQIYRAGTRTYTRLSDLS